MKSKEFELQKACVNWFRYQYPQHKKLLFAIPNGGLRNKATAGKLKAEGVVAGVFDLMLAVPVGLCHGMFIEMKVKPNKLTQNQKEWQLLILGQGYFTLTCYSFDEFKKQIEWYFRVKSRNV